MSEDHIASESTAPASTPGPTPTPAAAAPATASTSEQSSPPRPSHGIIDPAGWQRIAHALGLSNREIEVVQRIFDGHAEARIAWLLAISPHTVHTYVKRIYEKLEVSDRGELILHVIAEHLKGLSPE